jgi:hypothetical protein
MKQLRNQESEKPSILWVATLVAVLVALVLVAMQPSPQSDMNNGDENNQFSPPGPPMYPERVSSIAQAELLLAQGHIAVPSWLPDGFGMQGIFIDRGTGRVQIVFGASPMPPEIQFQSEAIAKGYWILMIGEGIPDPESYIDYVVEVNQGQTEEIVVGNHPGLLTYGVAAEKGSYVAWWMNGQTFELMTGPGATRSDLLRFCESVQ